MTSETISKIEILVIRIATLLFLLIGILKILKIEMSSLWHG